MATWSTDRISRTILRKQLDLARLARPQVFQLAGAISTLHQFRALVVENLILPAKCLPRIRGGAGNLRH